MTAWPPELLFRTTRPSECKHGDEKRATPKVGFFFFIPLRSPDLFARKPLFARTNAGLSRGGCVFIVEGAFLKVVVAWIELGHPKRFQIDRHKFPCHEFLRLICSQSMRSRDPGVRLHLLRASFVY